MQLNENQEKLVQAVRNMASGCRFASFTYSPKSTGGTFRYTLLLGASYKSLVEKSLEQLREINSLPNVDNATFTQARQEMLDSFAASLDGVNTAYTKSETYVSLGNGVKLNVNDFSFEIDGLIESKIELSPAHSKRPSPVSPKAKAKAALRHMLPVSRYASFCLDGGCLESARVNGSSLEM